MRKIIILILSAILTVLLVGCAENMSIYRNGEHQTIKKIEITENATNDRTMLEVRDNKNNKIKYYFVSGVGATVYYKDGTSESLESAMSKERVTSTDLKDFGIPYFLVPDAMLKNEKNDPNVHQESATENNVSEYVIKNIAGDEIGQNPNKGLLLFYEDEEFLYAFPTYENIVVYYENGKQESVTEALGAGRITFADLDAFEIDYLFEKK